MSNYLQRLVRSIAHPREAVHPRTGSIYAPHHNALGLPLQTPGEEEIPAARPISSRMSVNDDAEEREQTSEKEVPALTPLLPKIIAHSPAPESDIVHPRENRQVSTEGSQSPALGQEMNEAEDRVTARERPATHNTSHNVANEPYHALIKPSPASEASPNRPVARASQSDLRRSVAKREPDEIQIHIGRIEVTAVPPPPPRAQKAPDKSLSLDAYLNRRNGRAG